MSKEEVFSDKNSLSDAQLKKWCQENNLRYNLVELENLEDAKSRFAFIFTGNESNEANKGNKQHWLFLDGKYIFDSYGNPKSYNLPEGFVIIQNEPRQLQQFNSTTCGEYCCAFYDFISKNKSIKPEDIGEEFSDEFGFTGNRSKNDKLVFEWFHGKD